MFNIDTNKTMFLWIIVGTLLKCFSCLQHKLYFVNVTKTKSFQSSNHCYNYRLLQLVGGSGVGDELYSLS